MFLVSFKAGLAFLALCKVASSTTYNVAVTGTSSHAIPSTLYGLMFEDINQSGDGGLYGELLQNRAFQQVSPGTTAALDAWAPLGSTSHISVVKSSAPVSQALPNSLSLAIPSGTTGTAGFSNSGYWGINVNTAWTYTASFYFRFPAPPSKQISSSFVIGLQTSTGATVAYGTVYFTSSSTWKQVSVQFKPTSSAPNTSNKFFVSTNGATLAGQTVEFAMFSLFPPTFNGRANGMRVDLAEALLAMKPAFFRFPGGNNVEGHSTANRWQWNNTVGSLLDRPGRVGDWTYVNTDGLGIYEYLQWIEDMGMQPIMAVWAGFSLGGTEVPESSLQPYIQQAIDQINFVIGDPAKSAAAAMRSSMGHSQPFTLNYVEIGNEDFVDNKGSYSAYRWHDFVTALMAEFPQLTFISTSGRSLSLPSITPSPQAWDLHVYQTPTWFAQNSFYYDGAKRNGVKFFEGEYAVTSTNSTDLYGTVSQGRLEYPTVQGSVGEAAFMTGLERNSDIVFAASYAPLLNNVANSQWTPNLVSFNANTVIQSTSYYVQKMFSLSKGNQYLPSTLPATTGPVFWSVTRDSTTNNVFLKVVNTATSSNTVTFTLPYKSINTAGTGTLLTGSATASNTPSAPNAVVPSSFTFGASAKFSYVAPANSVSVLTVNAH